MLLHVYNNIIVTNTVLKTLNKYDKYQWHNDCKCTYYKLFYPITSKTYWCYKRFTDMVSSMTVDEYMEDGGELLQGVDVQWVSTAVALSSR